MHFEAFSNLCTTVIGTSTPLNQTFYLKMDENIARSRLFGGQLKGQLHYNLVNMSKTSQLGKCVQEYQSLKLKSSGLGLMLK